MRHNHFNFKAKQWRPMHHHQNFGLPCMWCVVLGGGAISAVGRFELGLLCEIVLWLVGREFLSNSFIFIKKICIFGNQFKKFGDLFLEVCDLSHFGSVLKFKLGSELE